MRDFASFFDPPAGPSAPTFGGKGPAVPGGGGWGETAGMTGLMRNGDEEKTATTGRGFTGCGGGALLVRGRAEAEEALVVGI